MTSKFLAPQEIADELGVDVQTVRRWIHAGRLRAFKPGKEYRVREADLQEFLEAREVRPKAPRRSPFEPSFNDVISDERRSAFIERVRACIEARTAHYAQRLREAEEGTVGPLAGYEGAVLLSDDAFAEFRDLPDLINGELAERWMMDPDIAEDTKVALARAVGQIMEPFVEIVRRISVREWELAETAAQKSAAERRREQIRERTRKINAA